jgi:hypothetical protein
MMLRHDPEVVAHRIQRIVPDVRLLAVLRDPVDRANSAMVHHIVRHRLPTDVDLAGFLRAQPAEAARLELIAGGWYAASLEPFVHLFGEQLRVLLYDDLLTDPRAFYADAANLKPPVELIEKTRIYPLKGEARPMKFPDASGVPVDMLPMSDASAFDALKKLVDAEGPHLADPDWMGMLAGLGIVKGEPFRPDERLRGILDRAAKSAYKMSRAIAFDEEVSGRSFVMYPGRRWVNPMADATAEQPSGKLDMSWRRVDRGGALDVDCRPWFSTNYYSISPGMVSQVPGKGAFYVISFTDGDGVPLSGGANYKLTLPKDVPAANFWSLTLYESENASGLANGQPFPSLGSRDMPVQNADGSTDLFLGPKAPEGREKNWLATVPGRGYFAVLRLYGPTEPALTKTWKPGDVTKMK